MNSPIGPRDSGSLSDNDPWRLNEEVRRRRLREDARRSKALNLSEGLALSEFLSTFAGSARRR